MVGASSMSHTAQAQTAEDEKTCRRITAKLPAAEYRRCIEQMKWGHEQDQHNAQLKSDRDRLSNQQRAERLCESERTSPNRMLFVQCVRTQTAQLNDNDVRADLKATFTKEGISAEYLNRCTDLIQGTPDYDQCVRKLAEWRKKQTPQSFEDFRAAKSSAEKGDVAAQYQLAQMYSEGRGIPPDGASAVSWFRRAAERGYADAQSALGEALCEGYGVARNPTEGLRWYQRAAEQGHVIAQLNLGYVYAVGPRYGIPHDETQARFWTEKAAAQGNSQARRNLAIMDRGTNNSAASNRGGNGSMGDLADPNNPNSMVQIQRNLNEQWERERIQRAQEEEQQRQRMNEATRRIRDCGSSLVNCSPYQ